MAYIDKAFYDHVFYNDMQQITEIPVVEFFRLADIASEMIYDICVIKPNEDDEANDTFKKAVAYQVEMLHKQGGIDAIVGFSEAAQAGGSESLGDYSISTGSAHEAVITRNGIPISTMSLMLLKRLGLMSRWAYAPMYRGGRRGQ